MTKEQTETEKLTEEIYKDVRLGYMHKSEAVCVLERLINQATAELRAEVSRLGQSLEIIETQYHEQLEDDLKPLQQEIEQLRQALEKAEMERDVFKRQLEEYNAHEQF